MEHKGRLNAFISKFFEKLWEKPEIVASMLMKAKASEITQTLIPLIGDNFYENILSSKYLQSSLIYVITILLKYEINNCDEYHPEKFLDSNSPCGYLLYELRAKNDYQIFIKKVVEDVVSELDHCSYNFCFEINKINENISNALLDIKHEKINNSNFNIKEKDIINNVVNKRIGNTYINYDINSYMKDIDFEKDFRNEIDKDILNYYKNILKRKNLKRKNPFVNGINHYLKETIEKQDYKKEIIIFYQNDFFIVKKFIEKFLNNLISNLTIMPYSIKVISKTISLLIKKKFPHLCKIDHNVFIFRFFFSNLFYRILADPSFGSIINNYIITKHITNNLQIIIEIFVQFFSGKLYLNRENYYLSPFNKLFIEKMPELIKFVDKLIDVNLPKYVENVINNNEYKFDIYNENKDEGFMFKTICFTIHDIEDIVLNIKNQDQILNEKNENFKIYFNKLKDNESTKMIKKIKNEEKENNKLYYFLIKDCLYLNDNIKKLFNIKKQSNHFEIKEISKPVTDEDLNKNLVIKTKNFIIKLLFNFVQLTREDFSKDCSMNINDIFKELKDLSNIPNYIVDNKIPTPWYVSSIIESLPKLPKELTDNNCQKLIEEMINDIKLSIKELDFESLTLIHSKLNFIQRSNYSNESTIKVIKNIYLNEKVESIIKSDNIEVGLYFHFDEGNTIFSIVHQKLILDFNVIDNDSFIKIEPKISKTITSFIDNFPDFTIYQGYLKNLNILEFEEKLHVPEQLSAYFKIINNYLENTNRYSKDDIKEIENKLYDYVMVQLYDKLYPQGPIGDENAIYQKMILYSWVESKHFIEQAPGANYNRFLPDVIEYLQSMIKEKSPRKNLENLSKVFNAIKDVIEFNGEKGLLGVDNFLTLLVYSFIKAQPYRIYSTIKYAMLYNHFEKTGQYALQLTELLSAYQHIKELSFDKLINITKEEYNKKMFEHNMLELKK